MGTLLTKVPYKIFLPLERIIVLSYCESVVLEALGCNIVQCVHNLHWVLYRHMLVLCSEKWRDTLSPSLNNFWYYSYFFVSVCFSLTLTVKVLSIGTLLTKVPFKIFNCYMNKAKMKTFSKCIFVCKGG